MSVLVEYHQSYESWEILPVSITVVSVLVEYHQMRTQMSESSTVTEMDPSQTEQRRILINRNQIAHFCGNVIR